MKYFYIAYTNVRLYILKVSFSFKYRNVQSYLPNKYQEHNDESIKKITVIHFNFLFRSMDHVKTKLSKVNNSAITIANYILKKWIN